MLTTDHYECTWDLLSSIPSLEHPGQTIRDETVAINVQHEAHSRARLLDRNRFKVDSRRSFQTSFVCAWSPRKRFAFVARENRHPLFRITR